MVSWEVSSARKSLRFVSGRGCHRRRHGSAIRVAWSFLVRASRLGTTWNRESAYPALRQEKIKAKGFNETVVNAGMRGTRRQGDCGDLSKVGCAWHGIEFAILRMAASHGFEP